MREELILQQIKQYIDEIKTMYEEKGLPFNKKQDLKRAYDAYSELYLYAEKGKIETATLHENITSFFYMLQ